MWVRLTQGRQLLSGRLRRASIASRRRRGRPFWLRRGRSSVTPPPAAKGPPLRPESLTLRGSVGPRKPRKSRCSACAVGEMGAQVLPKRLGIVLPNRFVDAGLGQHHVTGSPDSVAEG